MSIDHYENFPVASVLCPPALRPAVRAIYGFARTADDLADEGAASAAQRLQQLAAYRGDLDAVLGARQPGSRWATVFLPLAQVCRDRGLPGAPLHALLDAFEQDVRDPVYADRDDLLAYCARSANPIGRLLLHLYDVTDPLALRQSDCICSALQLINFWQDLSVDLPRGRVYIPQSDMRQHQLSSAQLLAGEDSPRARALVRSLTQWAHGMLLQGAPLCTRLPGRAGWELRLVLQGGLQILEKIAAMDHASLHMRPVLRRRDLPRMIWRAWRMP